ncbi:NAD(P)/FAD-dependent oxidoreductase [Candidatus Cloacimonadota bacterium]
MKNKTALIIGAGPAGLTAAYELLKHTNIKPVILEATDKIGGISQTVNFKGNRIDIGGHRFFSKSDTVMNWWQNILPIQEDDDERNDILLKRNRLSRILFLRKFFNYPISFNIQTIKNLGFKRLLKIGYSYAYIRLFPIKKEKSLEDFFINRFGNELYKTFFRDYTEKVWGIPCSQIKPEWGAQRIKGLSISTAIWHAVKKIFISKKSINQKNTETSLIEQFLYPKYGPGQLWEKVAEKIIEQGGEIRFKEKVVNIHNSNKGIESILTENVKHELKDYKCDYLISTMPIKDLIYGMVKHVPFNVQEVAKNLIYRDFITVGLLLKQLKIKNKKNSGKDLIQDNWIYIQEPDVKMGRLQIFNNWSPYLVKDPDTAWVGLEYFCNEGDELWNKNDTDFADFAVEEFIKIGMIDPDDVIDSIVIRMPKTYPAYFGSYDRFAEIREFTDEISNLFLIGRNGMHRYNNQDHSMLTAITAVQNIKLGITSKENIWNVNAEQEYHESK